MSAFRQGFVEGVLRVLKLRGVLTYSSLAVLAALALGVDIGPEEINKIVAGVVTITGIYGRWRATRS